MMSVSCSSVGMFWGLSERQALGAVCSMGQHPFKPTPSHRVPDTPVHQEMAAMPSFPHQQPSRPVSPVSSVIKDRSATATWMCLCLVHCCKPRSVDQVRLGFSASTKAPALAVPHSPGRKCPPGNHKPPFPTAQAAGARGIFATVLLRA